MRYRQISPDSRPLTMADVHTPAVRSKNMAAIRSRDTKPEIELRRLVHRLGYRFTLRSRLPGKPDLVLPRHRKVIFLHGCFWHLHNCRYGRVSPATRAEFWATKRGANVERDRRALRALRKIGWRPFVVWECWLRDRNTLIARLKTFLEADD